MLFPRIVRPKRLFIATALLLLASAVGAQVTPESPLSQPQYGPAQNDQTNPVVASDGTNFLVAWIDYRGRASIYANRVTAAGEVLDGTGIRVPTELTNPASQPGKLLGLFHIDGAYTLIYKTYDLSSPPLVPPTTQAVIISDDGQILDGPRQVLDHAVNLVASNGNRIVIVNGSDLFILNGRAEVLSHGHDFVVVATPHLWSLPPIRRSALPGAASNTPLRTK